MKDVEIDKINSADKEALIFFQASSFQLLQLENLLRWSFFTFKKVVAINFYWSTDIIKINQKVIIDNYQFIDWFSAIGFYGLH